MRGTPGAVLLAGCALAGLLVGCGETDSGAAPRADGPPLTRVENELLVSCGGDPGWVPSAMVNGIEPAIPRSEIEAALDAIATEPKLSVETSRVLPQGGRTPWKLLAEDDDHLTIALGDWTFEGPARDAMTMSLEREGEGWKWTGHGNCWHLAPVLDDGTWVNLSSTKPLDTTSTTVTVDVTELACTGSRDPVPHLDEPSIVTTSHDVTVYWTSRPPQGAQECPGNPTVSQQLTLDEPLGDRVLLDGSRWPPVPIG
ncbi:hypothetical protein [Nocardioides zhouii]|uniref:Uncharacterized protein n=1 Tax=Nocardioides zhouii TaxID=1168729 RepID=A0A4Q2TBV3_9ACTN|nr:hypothetical protein [Nocardioides zhouii]RYC14608.1 hypothetical protein EUA94_00335 [Nocardioides zhouii]